jgi:hypothetical protein
MTPDVTLLRRFAMTAAVRQFLETFDALPEADKHQAAIEILRRATAEARGDLPEVSLVEAADEAFRGLDEQEGNDAAG